MTGLGRNGESLVRRTRPNLIEYLCNTTVIIGFIYAAYLTAVLP